MKVFGHRGACAYRPENTLESFQLAFEMGVEAIECDIVPTKDGVLVLRHESDLQETTDILSRPTFEGRTHSNQITSSELQELRAIERLPECRPGSAKFDGQFLVPTLSSLLNSPMVTGKTLILEVKDTLIFDELGFDMVELFAAELEDSKVFERATLWIEAFEAETMDRLRAKFGHRFRLIYGMEEWDEVNACNYDAVSLDFELIKRRDDLVATIHQAGLLVYGFTARAEFAENSVEEYYHQLIETGVDGIFADHPDLLLNYVEGLA